MRIRTLWLLAFLWAILPVSGCELTKEQKLAAVDRAIAGLQDQSSLFAAALKDPTITPEQRAKMEAAKVKVDGVVADLQLARTDIAAGRSVNLTAVLSVATTILGTTATAVGGAAGQWLQLIAAVLGALVAGGGGLLYRQRGQLETAQTAVREIVQGAEIFKNAAPPEAVTTFKVAQKDAQSEETARMVALAKVQSRAQS